MKRGGAFLFVVALACRQPDPPPVTAPWTDAFERTGIGSDYLATQDSYRVEAGRLKVQEAYNHPLWLRKKLPRDAVIELDCGSNAPEGDIKVEAWGDGSSYDPDKGSYRSSAYVFIFGGWNNSRSLLARQDEHTPGQPSRTAPKVEIGRGYHYKIVRKGNQLDWFIDDMTTPFLTMTDHEPLAGPGHEYFGFNDWKADVWFDNLSITPLK